MKMNTKTVARFVSIALIGAAFAGPQVFAADPSDAVRTETIKFADLSLDSQAGAVSLYQRIHQAAKRVCEQPGTDQRNLRVMDMQQSCIARAESRAVDNVHSGALSVYYQMTLGHASVVTASNNVK